MLLLAASCSTAPVPHPASAPPSSERPAPATVTPPVSLATTGPFVPTAIAFADAQTGWVAGCREIGHCMSELQRTVDGGQSWETLALPAETSIRSIVLADTRTGWVLQWSGGPAYVTWDGGATWLPQVHDGWSLTTLSVANGWAWGIERPECPSGVVCPQVGRIVRGPVSGPLVPLSQPPSELLAFNEVVAAGPDDAYVGVGEIGTHATFSLMATNDGGTTWRGPTAMCRGDSMQLALLGREHLFGSCSFVPYPTTSVESVDGGRTWAPSRLGGGRWTSGPFPVDEDSVLYDFDDGQGLRLSHDGGLTSSQVFAVGSAPRGLRLVDGYAWAAPGQIWLLPRSVEPRRPHSIIHSEDGGDSWRFVSVT